MALAIRRFSTSSKRLGCSIGRSAGLAPARTRALRYRKMGKAFKDHRVINHGAGQYGLGDITTNTVGLLLDLQTRHEGHVSALRRATLASLSGGV
jgi:hypothetical protein